MYRRCVGTSQTVKIAKEIDLKLEYGLYLDFAAAAAAAVRRRTVQNTLPSA